MENTSYTVGDEIIFIASKAKGYIKHILSSGKVVAEFDGGTVVVKPKDFMVVVLPVKYKIERLRALIDCALLVGDQDYFKDLVDSLNHLLEAPTYINKPQEVYIGEPSVKRDATKEEICQAVVDLALDMKDFKLLDEYQERLFKKENDD